MMKYIITERQYHILKEEEEKVIHLPSIDYFGGWYDMQSYLDKKGNPLYSIDGNLKLIKTPIKSLGNLTSVGGNLNLRNTSIKSLGNLTSVGGDLFLEGTLIESLGNLTFVGGSLDLKDILAFKKYSIKEIEKMVDVEGKIYI